MVKTADGVQANGQTSFFVGSRIPDAAGDQGYFVDWSWDGNTVHVRSEPWGFAPVFFHSTANEFIVSTDIDAGLDRRGSAKLDFPAVAAFMRLGFFLGDDTRGRASARFRLGPVPRLRGAVLPLLVTGSAPAFKTAVANKRLSIRVPLQRRRRQARSE